MRITESQLRRIIREVAIFNPMYNSMTKRGNDDTDILLNPNGTRNNLATLLSQIAKSGSAGLEIEKTPEINKLVYARFIVFGLDPRGGYRARITGEGRDALANI